MEEEEEIVGGALFQRTNVLIYVATPRDKIRRLLQ